MNPRRTNGSKRSKLIARVRREETHCHLCDQWVDRTLPPGLPGSPEVDEIIPVAYGGNPYDRTNCRLAHRYCNRLRWHRPVEAGRADLAVKPPTFNADGTLADTRPQPVVSRSW